MVKRSSDSSRSWWRKIIIVMVVAVRGWTLGSCESGKAKAGANTAQIGYFDAAAGRDQYSSVRFLLGNE